MDNTLHNRSETFKGYAAVLATAFLWSLGGLFIKLVPWSALSINAARCIIALLLKTVVRKSVKIKFTPAVIVAGLSFTATATFFIFANKYTTSANAILLQYSAPLFIMVYAWIHARRRPSGSDVLTSLVIIGGVALCCLDNLGGGTMLGNLFGILSGVFFALVLYVNSLPGASPDDANYLGFLLSIIIGIPSLVHETTFTLPIAAYIVVLGAFQIGLAYILLEYGIKRISALSAVFVSAIEPILNPVWVAIFYGETIGPFAILGGALVLGASIFHSVRNARRAVTTTDP